ITHLNLDTQRGLVGLSPGGGVPSPFIESDLSAYTTCFPPFTISAPQYLDEGSGTWTGVVALESTFTNDITVTLGSSDTNEIIVPPSVLIPAGEIFGYFDLAVVDDNVVDGPRTVTIMGTSPGFRSAEATITVNDNEPVELTLIAPPVMWENAGT